MGFEIFEKIFRDADFLRALKNSLVFNFLDLAIGFPIPIILALMLNELRFQPVQAHLADCFIPAAFPELGYHRKRRVFAVSPQHRDWSTSH